MKKALFGNTTQLPDGRIVNSLNTLETLFIHHEIFEARTYLQHGITIQADDIVVDVGANVGLFTLFTKDNAPSAKIISIEPVPEAFAALRLNNKKFQTNATLINRALSHSPGFVDITYNPFLSTMASLYGPAKTGGGFSDFMFYLKCLGLSLRAGGSPGKIFKHTARTVQAGLIKRNARVELTTLSNIIHDRNIDKINLLKIDVEGAEFDVLAGILPRDWEKIEQLVIEVHPPRLKVNEPVELIKRMLEERGFTVIPVEEPGANRAIELYFGFEKQAVARANNGLFSLTTLYARRRTAR